MNKKAQFAFDNPGVIILAILGAFIGAFVARAGGSSGFFLTIISAIVAGIGSFIIASVIANK